MPVNLENSAEATGLEKVSFNSNSKEGRAKECSNYCTIALIAHASKVMLKILQARFQQCVNWEFSYIQVGFRKVRRTRDQISTCIVSYKKQENSRKTSISASLTMPKPLCGSQLCKVLKEMGTPQHLTCLRLRWPYLGWIIVSLC